MLLAASEQSRRATSRVLTPVLPPPQPIKIHKKAGGDAKRGAAAGGGGEGGFVDKEMECKDCQAPFTFTAGEQEFYKTKGFDNEPVRGAVCSASRRIWATRLGICTLYSRVSRSPPARAPPRRAPPSPREEEDRNILRTPSEPFGALRTRIK